MITVHRSSLCKRDHTCYHDNPESAAQKVNEVWDNVEGWWGQDKVQEARRQFCNRYARVSQNPVRELKQILLRQIS